MKAKLHYVLSITITLFFFSVYGQNNTIRKIESIKNVEKLEKYQLKENQVDFYQIDLSSLKANLVNSKFKYSKDNSNYTITLPVENGEMVDFRVYENSILSPSLAAKYPNIKSYSGISTDGKGAALTMSLSPQGIQTMVSFTDSNKPWVFMQRLDKKSNEYVVYTRKDKNYQNKTFLCNTLDELETSASKLSSKLLTNEGGANDKTLRKFRIAISTTSEYTAYHDDGNNGNGDAIADAVAAINATLSRVNAIFETDMAIRFTLVDALDLIYNDAANDPYSDSSVGADDANSNNLNGWSLQLQNTLSASPDLGNNLSERNAAYDIGHLFGATGGGGNAGCIGCVCNDDTASNMDKNKGSAFTSPADAVPEGDTFDLNFVIHEIGHQMGGNHTWAYTNESGNSVQSEPGSGTTLMAYAGITGQQDVQADSDPYFHYQSIKQILTTVSSKTCQTTESIGNNSPLANAGIDYEIPAGTPYVLKGSATDSDGSDILSYCWEQIDNGTVNFSNFGPTLTTGSVNRSLLPSNSPNRYIPRLSSVLEGRITQSNPGHGSDWETASTVNRTLNWALTVRDRTPSPFSGGQSSYDTMQITVNSAAGPFQVTSQSNYISYPVGSSQLVTWDVASTNQAPIGTTQVNILLSTDGGLTFSHMLASNIANDGSENITLPSGVSAPFCRIMVEAVNNIYYSVNTTDFAIGYDVSTTCNQQFNSNPNLNLSINDGFETTNIINVPSSGIISDLKVNVDLDHTWISDLTVTLTHVNSNTSVIVWNESCDDENNFDIIFMDGAVGPACINNISGSFTPANPLSAFDGLDMSGNWEISIIDSYAGDTGSLTDWYIEVCTTSSTLDNPDVSIMEDLKVFPNPSTGMFTVQLQNSQSKQINLDVFDIHGRKVLGQLFTNNGDINEQIDMSNAQSGIYILQVHDGVRKATRKLIVDK